MGALGFSAEALQESLQTAQFGRAAYVVGEAPSTIDLAWEWLRAGGPEGGVVIAERQTRGRGRRGRQWESPRGGLWMSLLTRPRLAAGRVGRLGVGLCLAGAEALGLLGMRAGVKWPNDLVVDEGKVGGVLVETELSGEMVSSAVLSIGLNVNIRADDLPAELRADATSLLAATGQSNQLEAVAARVLNSLERIWSGLLTGELRVAARWRECDVLLGQEVRIVTGERTLRGRASGINEDGALLLAGDEQVRPVTAGEVMGFAVEA